MCESEYIFKLLLRKKERCWASQVSETFGNQVNYEEAFNYFSSFRKLHDHEKKHWKLNFQNSQFFQAAIHFKINNFH